MTDPTDALLAGGELDAAMSALLDVRVHDGRHRDLDPNGGDLIVRYSADGKPSGVSQVTPGLDTLRWSPSTDHDDAADLRTAMQARGWYASCLAHPPSPMSPVVLYEWYFERTGNVTSPFRQGPDELVAMCHAALACVRGERFE